MRKYLHSSLGLVGVLLATVITIGCSDDNTDTDNAIDEGQQRGESNASLVDSALDGLSDRATIIGISGMIVLTIDDGEIMQAEVALDVARDARVIDFAEMMIDQHSLHREMTLDALAAEGANPIDSQVAAQLMREAMAGVAMIQNAIDPDYDYMRMQVVMHNEALVIIDRLIDAAPDATFAAFLADTRAAVDQHRMLAETRLRQMD